MRGKRLCRWLKWCGVAVCVAIIGLWVLGGFWAPLISYVGQRASIGFSVASGQLGVVYSPTGGAVLPPSGPGFNARIERRKAGYPRWRWQAWWGFGTIPSPPLTIGYIPLHLFLIAFGLPTSTLFYVDRLHRAPASCSHCGYDRVGLTAESPCPECGVKPTSPRQS